MVYPQIPGTFPLIPSPDHKYVAYVNNIVNIIGASVSEPHIDEFASNFLYMFIYIYLSYVVP